MTTLQSFAVTGDTTAQAIANLAHAVGEAPTGAHFVCVFYDAEHEDDEEIVKALLLLFEEATEFDGGGGDAFVLGKQLFDFADGATEVAAFKSGGHGNELPEVVAL